LATTQIERRHDKETGRSEPTGRLAVSGALAITIGDFELLDALGSVLAGDERLDVWQVVGNVDDDKQPNEVGLESATMARTLHRSRPTGSVGS